MGDCLGERKVAVDLWKEPKVRWDWHVHAASIGTNLARTPINPMFLWFRAPGGSS